MVGVGRGGLGDHLFADAGHGELRPAKPHRASGPRLSSRDRAGRAPARDVVISRAVLAQHVDGVFAQLMAAAGDGSRGGGELDRLAGDAHRFGEARKLDGRQHLAGGEMGVVGDLVDVQHRAEWHDPAEPLLQVGLGHRRRQDRQALNHLQAVGGAGLGRGELRFIEDFRRAERAAQGAEERIARTGQGDEAVGGRIDAKGQQKRMVVALRPRNLMAEGILVHDALADAEDRIGHGHVEELALAQVARGVQHGADDAQAPHRGLSRTCRRRPARS